MSLFLLLLYSVAVLAAALFGAWIPRRMHMTHTRTQMMMSLVSGLMLGVALYHLVPHSLAASGHIDFTMQWVMAGLVFMLLMLRLFHFHQHDFASPGGECEVAVADHHAHAHDHAHIAPPRSAFSSLGLFAGLGIHTMVDGVALGAVMRTDNAGGLLGLGVFLAILLHKPLDALSIETVMQASGWRANRRSQVNWLFAALCPLTALAFYFGVDFNAGASPLMPAALAFSAGAFVCIALGDLLPEVQFHSHDRVKLTLLFLLGIGLAYAIGWLEPAH